ncbi:MAG TPA: HD-GYP domain-containing protein [Desulfomicrobiaceae bacterium]|nr:HD-GYP domain-containing protein [Desulfomicrobiaceae bacterium]
MKRDLQLPEGTEKEGRSVPALVLLRGAECSPDCSKLIETVHEFSESLGVAIDAKDPYTRTHSTEVAEAAQVLAGSVGLAPDQVKLVHIGGHLHDIGKIGVPDSILNKVGPLDAGEWAMLKQHPDIGARILEPVRTMTRTGIPAMVRHHHEAFDGTGYPHGLAGQEIPLGARIIAVADSLSAMLSDRPYRPRMSYSDALAEVIRCRGTQFDPVVVRALLCRAGEIGKIFASQPGTWAT